MTTSSSQPPSATDANAQRPPTAGSTTTAAAAASRSKSSDASTKTTSGESPALTDQAVLDYLKRKGLGTAALELSNILKEQESNKGERQRLEEEDAVFRNQRTVLAKVNANPVYRRYIFYRKIC